MPYRRVISAILLVSGLLWLTGCAEHEGLRAGMHRSITTPSSPVIERVPVAVQRLSPEAAPASLDYQIGVGDLIAVTVYGRPELSSSPQRPSSRVDGNGNIQLPLVGSVKVAGLTASAIRDKIESLLLRFIQSPSVMVEVTLYRSKPLYIMGQFRLPGVFYMERPMTLLQGIALGNGFDPIANLRGVRLLRDKQIVPVDLYALLNDGQMEENIWLRAGDTIFIPDNKNQNVFVFGAVQKQGLIAMPQGRMSLMEAVAIASLKTSGYDLNNVRIIRSLSTTTGELLVVDLERMLRGETLPLQLVEGDIVYVPKNKFGTWASVINEILPSIQAISSSMQPFVMLKYLSGN